MSHLLPIHLTAKPTAIAMPRAVQPGGISGKRRARYTARRRVALLASARRIQEEEGLSLRAAADQLRVSHSLFVRWQHRDAGVADPLFALLRGKKKSSHPGPIGQLKPFEDGLL